MRKVQEEELRGKSLPKIEQHAIKKPLPLLNAQDPVIDVNLGTTNFSRFTKICSLLSKDN